METGVVDINEVSVVTKHPERLLKAVEVAEILNVSRAFAYQLMQRGEIRTVAIGTARRVRRKDLQEFIDRCLDPPIKQDSVR